MSFVEIGNQFVPRIFVITEKEIKRFGHRFFQFFFQISGRTLYSIPKINWNVKYTQMYKSNKRLPLWSPYYRIPAKFGSTIDISAHVVKNPQHKCQKDEIYLNTPTFEILPLVLKNIVQLRSTN